MALRRATQSPFWKAAPVGLRMAGTVVAAFWELPVSEAAMWTPEDRLLVGDFGSGQALTGDQFRLLEPLIPPARPPEGGREKRTCDAC